MKELTERERAVLQLLKEGLTLQVIATRLELTRNTVSGIVYRMKAAGVSGVHYTGANGKTSIKIKPTSNLRRRGAAAPATATGPVTLLDLRRTSCRFILGDDLTYYCGEEADPAPYCQKHRAVCYTSRQTPA